MKLAALDPRLRPILRLLVLSNLHTLLFTPNGALCSSRQVRSEMRNPDAVIQRITAAIPQNFWTYLQERQLAIYNQSLAMAFGESWGVAEAHSVLPVIRRALFESTLRESAVAAKLEPWDSPHVGNNSSCVTVKAPGLVITGHFIDGPNQIPQEAESRKQNAALNKFYQYHTDERLLTNPLPKLDGNAAYVLLLHGAQFPGLRTDNLAIDPTTCFLRAAVPAVDCRTYLFNWSFEELLAEYSPNRPVEQQPALEDNARPRRKVQRPDEKTTSRNEGR